MRAKWWHWALGGAGAVLAYAEIKKFRKGDRVIYAAPGTPGAGLFGSPVNVPMMVTEDASLALAFTDGSVKVGPDLTNPDTLAAWGALFPAFTSMTVGSWELTKR